MNTVFPPSDLRAWCAQLYGNQQRLVLTPYAYTIDFGDFAIDQTKTQQAQITANADFIALSLAISVGESSGVSNFKALVSDSSTGEQFTSAAALFGAIGNGEGLGFVQNNFAYPRFIGGNSSIAVQLTNTYPATAVPDVYFVLRGFLVRSLGG